jgi:Zn-dependent M28 family amino/carboxypeptidase
MFFVPGRSYRGPLPALTAIEQELSSKLSTHVWMLASDIGPRSLTSAPENLEQAALYIEQILRSYGHAVSTQEFDVDVFTSRNRKITSAGINFESANYKTRNIIAEIVGSQRPEEIVVVGAHYDSVYDCPAANDNGSGVAALLAIAQMFAQAKCERTIRFVAFTNEEPPFFDTDSMGSLRYARSCHERGDKVVAMICLETLGYYTDAPQTQKLPHPIFKLFCPTTGNFIALIANLKSRQLLKQCAGAFRKAVKFPSEALALPDQITGVSFSDHSAFWRYGYPALMITDTAFYRYPYYHEAEDTPEKIDYDVMARVVQGLGAVVADLCGDTRRL